MLESIKKQEEIFWINPNKIPFDKAKDACELTLSDIEEAAARWDRFAAFFRRAYPETASTHGIVESPLWETPKMKEALEALYGVKIGSLWLKPDSHLPISGSIKARGGVYEVLELAERIATERGLLTPLSDYGVLCEERFKKLFSEYSVAVGSTGNLGLSIGIVGAKLGFRVTVHMSADAKEWKKALLREKGAEVIEYASDYSEAVRQGRIAAEADPFCHFVDDENSKTLFLGYSVAALRLKKQLAQANISVDADHPLYVYLPCGVGGGPGGVAFGLKQVFGDAVRPFFAEPTEACCMTLGMITGLHDKISVQDVGLSGKTDADGLAVGRASGFVGKLMESFMEGCYTVRDDRLYRHLALLADTEKIFLEPSALAGTYGPILGARSEEYHFSENGTHLIWATGGNMVPRDLMQEYYNKGKNA